MTTVGDRRWNHNLHYHRLVLDAIPDGARTALDVGTGDGLLARDLRARVPHVVAIDIDPGVLARARLEQPAIDWVLGDIATHPFAAESFDVVATIATLHHLPDADAALTRMAELVAPGGALVVIGLARSSTVADAAVDLVGVVAHRILRRRRELWEHSAPTVWPPPHSFTEVRRAARATLPGGTWRRLVLWRYAIVWRRPRTSEAHSQQVGSAPRGG